MRPQGKTFFVENSFAVFFTPDIFWAGDKKGLALRRALIFFRTLNPIKGCARANFKKFGGTLFLFYPGGE